MIISIVIPCYNSSKWLKRTFKSLFDQTNKNFEIIFVDDGSTDNSLEIAKNILKNSKLQYKLIEQPNLGVSAARNIGIENSIGEYLYFLDSDDYLDKNFIEIAQKILAINTYDMLFFDFTVIKENKKIECVNKNISMENPGEILKLLLKGNLRYHMCAFLIKKSILTKNKIRFTTNFKYGEDNEFIIKGLCNCEIVKIVNDKIFYYMMQENSAVHKFNISRLDSIEAAKSCEKYICSKINENEVKILAKQYVANKLIYNLYQFIELVDINDKNMKNIEQKLLSQLKENRCYLKYLNYGQHFIKRNLIYLVMRNIKIYYRILIFKNKKNMSIS